MDYNAKFKRQVALRTFSGVVAPIILSVATYIGVSQLLDVSGSTLFISVGAVSLVSVIVASVVLTRVSTSTVNKLEEIISYAAHSDRADAAPNLENMHLGRELITAQSLQIYDLASTTQATTISPDTPQQQTPQEQQLHPATMLDSVPLPIIGLSSTNTIVAINKSALEYLGSTQENALGKPAYDVLSLSFQGDISLEEWLAKVKESNVTATNTWQRVKHLIDEDTSKQFDMVASFSSGSTSGTETMLALYDRTDIYGQDDQEIGFVALAVHELRTPLTIMRGYIEVFEDELGPTLNPELTEFMHKMHASAQQLAAFVGNILNIARIEENQLALKLRKEDWPTILKAAVSDLELRARVHNKHIELQIADGIPYVGADRISIHEVLNNLVDNAIKYSGDTDKILIKTYVNDQGMVETSVQDFGIGIPSAVLPQLFKKFHRSFKTRVQIGGTGLGLYLCKALIGAHGGNIWVRSKEGEGSIFSFTIMPYANISAEQVDGEDGIIRGAHGWIKNHSLYRN